jgi:hypothetical protein
MMTQIDEIERDKHINMTFVEFLEAVVRVAQKLEVPNLINDGFEPAEDEIEEEKRNEYANRPLEVKLESLILLLIRHQMPNLF